MQPSVAALPSVGGRSGSLGRQVLFAFVLFSLCSNATRVAGQGIIVSAGGAVNRSMGGAATAAPLDAMGAIYWNPATISGLADNQVDFSLDLLVANHSVASSAGPFGGSTDAEAGAVPIPNVAWTHRAKNPAITFGLGVNGIAGFKTNLLSDPTNPVLTPPPTGLGRVSAEATFLQLAPVLSIALTDRLSVAGGPTVTTGQLGVEPFVFDAPNTNGYSAGRATRYHWGGGFQVGGYYIYSPTLRFGASLKSPTWMERFEFYGQDAVGGPRILTADIDLPLILSLGASLKASNRLLVALDVRFVDFGNTAGLGDPATFDATGKLLGLDWSSVLATALGVQYSLAPSLDLRGGYTFNQNPVSDNEAFFNVASPLIYQHMLSGGSSLRISDSTSLNLAYSYMLDNSRTGPIFAPGVGAVPGTSITNSLNAHFFSFGMSIRH
ncbi:MAG: outer membrane protein transport protein [Planctomycetales bacterium]|nr:outer membrane protein transport protein [Planctomycetales bacterium]